ncbi:MAG TPA: zinc metallopeptidase [Gaiellaceae bacterium]|nr:zinc metallopeptidase [Gaiellaceae bacterium]
MSDWGLYFAFLIPPLLLGLGVQWWLKKTFAEQARVAVSHGMNGAQVARTVLDANGLHEVPVHVSPGGPLSDHYDPRKRSVHLSHPVFEEVSISATAVAAHEVGHAIQHKEAYSFFRFRSALFPAVAFSSSVWIWLLVIGFLLNAAGLVLVAIVLYAVAVLFQVVTLPVEFDASRRAAVQLAGLGLTTTQETDGVKKVLTAAALTYVAGALAALTQLLYFVLVFLGNRD